MRRYLIFFALFVLMVVNYIDRVNLSVAAPLIAQHFDLSPIQMGFLFSSFLWTYVLFLIPMGFAVDKWGARGIAGISLAVWSIAGMLTGAAPTFAILLLSRLLLGAGECSSFPVGGRVVREWAPRSERGIATAFLNSGAYAGPALGAVLTGWLVTATGWRESFYVTGLIGLGVALLWLAFYRRPEQAGWLSADEHAFILRERNDPRAHDAAEAGTEPLKLSRLFANRTIWALALIEGCAAYTLYLFLSWMPSYLLASSGLNVMKSGLFTAIPYVVAALAVMILSWISDYAIAKINRRTVLAICLLCSSVILLMPFATAVWQIILLISISLACVATAISLNITLANDLLSDGAYAGMSVGVVMVGGNFFGLIAPITTGYIVSSSAGYSGAFAIAGILLLLGATVCITATRKPIDTGAPLKIAAIAARESVQES